MQADREPDEAKHLRSPDRMDRRAGCCSRRIIRIGISTIRGFAIKTPLDRKPERAKIFNGNARALYKL